MAFRVENGVQTMHQFIQHDAFKCFATDKGASTISLLLGHTLLMLFTITVATVGALLQQELEYILSLSIKLYNVEVPRTNRSSQNEMVR